MGTGLRAPLPQSCRLTPAVGTPVRTPSPGAGTVVVGADDASEATSPASTLAPMPPPANPPGQHVRGPPPGVGAALRPPAPEIPAAGTLDEWRERAIRAEALLDHAREEVQTLKLLNSELTERNTHLAVEAHQWAEWYWGPDHAYETPQQHSRGAGLAAQVVKAKVHAVTLVETRC